MLSTPSSHGMVNALQRAVLLGLIGAPLASAASVDLVRRDGTENPPATIPIQLSYDQYGRYLIPIGMSQGSGEQNFNFTLSTSIGLTSVAGQSCTTCSSTNLYNQAKSTTAQSLDGTTGADLVGQTIEGTVIKELCTMQTANGSDWQYPNQTIVVAGSDSGSIFNDNVSGVIGLGTNRNAASTSMSGTNFTPSFNDTIYGQWLNRNPLQTTFQYGMSLGSPIATPKNTSLSQQTTVTPKDDAGRLDWLQPSSNGWDHNGAVTMQVSSNSNANYSTGGQPDFTVELDGWVFKSGGNEASNNDVLITTVDPYYTDIYFPLAQAQLLNELISGSTYEPTLSSLGNQSGSWVIPCDSTYSFTVAIGSATFTLDQDVLMTNADGLCTSGIGGWADSSISQYILGARFLSQFYVIFSVNRNGTDTVTLAPRSSSSSSTDVGAIVGGTVGGVAGLLLLALGAFFLWRRNGRRHYHDDGEKPTLDDHIAARVEPFTMPISAGPPTSAYSASSGAFAAQQAAYGFHSPPGSPQADDPLLRVHDVPPAYEATEGGSSTGPTSPARRAKGEYALPARFQNDEGASGSGRPSTSPMTASFTGVHNPDA